jgi:hypothetical protein
LSRGLGRESQRPQPRGPFVDKPVAAIPWHGGEASSVGPAALPPLQINSPKAELVPAITPISENRKSRRLSEMADECELPGCVDLRRDR